MTWTEEKIQTLRALWGQGKTANEIAAILGDGMSRNAVIGKAHRLKLSGRPSPIAGKAAAVTVRMPSAPAAPGKVEQRHVDRATTIKTAYGPGKKMENLGPQECRWPIGEGADMVCCSATVKHGVYCERHAHVSKPGNYNNEKRHSGIDQGQDTSTGTG